MSAKERHMEEAGNLVDEWLSEQEGYAIRAERMPEGSRDWLIAACSIGLAAGERRGMERAELRVRDLAVKVMEEHGDNDLRFAAGVGRLLLAVFTKDEGGE